MNHKVAKNKLIYVLLLCVIALVFTITGCVRPFVNDAAKDIPISSAPYIIEFANDGWIDGAILAESYGLHEEYVVVVNYYDRNGFHKETKLIPIDWIIAIRER